MGKLIRFRISLISYQMLLLFVAVNFNITIAHAACMVKVINQTGYDMEPLKFVQELGETKNVVGQAPLSNGKSQMCKLGKGGKYRAYGMLTKDGEKKYAKGNLYTFEDGASYSLTLKKVVFSEQGSSISFISKDEFDNLK
jgi:hypothetical protein